MKENILLLPITIEYMKLQAIEVATILTIIVELINYYFGGSLNQPKRIVLLFGNIVLIVYLIFILIELYLY